MQPVKASRNVATRAALPKVKLAPVVRGKTLGDQAYQSLRDALSSGALPPGHRLTVRGLVELLDVGFTPAREALNRLAAEGCLETGPGRGLFVPSLTAARYEESYTIRMALEPMAAKAALPHLTAADIDALGKLQDSLLVAKQRRDYVTVLARNREFHFSIYRRCGMPTLLGILDALYLQAGPTLRLLYPLYEQEWKGGINHCAVLKALRSRDATALVKAIRQDLRDGRLHLSEQLRQIDS